MSHPFPFLLTILLLPLVLSTRCPDILTTPSSRIVGGTPAPPPTASFTASLVQAFSSACTGSLLSPTWVLTARHCLPTNATFVFLSTSHRSSGPLISVRSVHLHPSDDMRDDIALVQLAEPAPLNATFVKINDNPQLPVAKAFVRAVGFGSTAYAGPPNRLLRQVDTPFVPTDECREEYGTPGVLDDRTLCAGYPQGRCGVCNGDSGGPLLQFDAAGVPVQVGIVSRSRGCAWEGTPAIFVRVSAFVPWMRSVGAEFAVATDAAQVMSDGQQVDTVTPQQQMDTREGSIPKWAIGLMAGGPMLAFVVVAVTVSAVGRTRSEGQEESGDKDESRASRQGEEVAREGSPGPEVEAAQDV